jgi:hypothetical protein
LSFAAAHLVLLLASELGVGLLGALLGVGGGVIVPGLPVLPLKLRVYRLIWRHHYRNPGPTGGDGTRRLARMRADPVPAAGGALSPAPERPAARSGHADTTR